MLRYVVFERRVRECFSLILIQPCHSYQHSNTNARTQVRRIRKQAGCRFEEIESDDETFRTFRLEGSDRAIQYAYSSVLSELERHGVDTSDRPGDFIGDILGEESSASFASNAFDLLVQNEMSRHLGTFSISMLMRSWMERGNEDDIERTLRTYTEFMPKRNMLLEFTRTCICRERDRVQEELGLEREFREMGEKLIHDSRKMLKNYRAFDQKILHVKTVTCVAGFALDMMSQVDETTSPLSDKIASFVLTVLNLFTAAK